MPKRSKYSLGSEIRNSMTSAIFKHIKTVYVPKNKSSNTSNHGSLTATFSSETHNGKYTVLQILKDQ